MVVNCQSGLVDQGYVFISDKHTVMDYFFAPEMLGLGGLNSLIDWLQNQEELSIASHRELIALFLIKSYREETTIGGKLQFISDLSCWLNQKINQEKLIFLDTNRKEYLPPIIDSIEATLERLGRLEKLVTAWIQLGATAISLGGSMSYGPFYNIRKQLVDKKGSDIDLLLIFDNPEDISQQELYQGLLRISVDSSEIHKLAAAWGDCWGKGIYDIFSNKVKARSSSESYEISFHVFRGESYNWLINPLTPKDCLLRAYRTRPFNHSPIQFNLKGGEFPLIVNNKTNGNGGFIMEMPAWPRDDDGVFSPNLYHNMILPNADIFLNPDNSTRIKIDVNRFLDYVYRHLETRDVAFTHIRRDFISPFLHRNLRNIKI